jgi:hypothetical protein
LPALSLDPLAAVDNPDFYTVLAAEPNLPPAVRDGLANLRPEPSTRRNRHGRQRILPRLSAPV